MIPKDYRNVDLMSIIFKTTSLLDFLSCRHVTVKTMSHSVWNTLHLLKMLLQMYLHKLSFGHNFTSKCLTSPIHSQPSSVNVQWTTKEHTSRRMKLSRKTWREINWEEALIKKKPIENTWGQFQKIPIPTHYIQYHGWIAGITRAGRYQDTEQLNFSFILV